MFEIIIFHRRSLAEEHICLALLWIGFNNTSFNDRESQIAFVA